jgi:hypothetical protein
LCQRPRSPFSLDGTFGGGQVSETDPQSARFHETGNEESETLHGSNRRRAGNAARRIGGNFTDLTWARLSLVPIKRDVLKEWFPSELNPGSEYQDVEWMHYKEAGGLCQ